MPIKGTRPNGGRADKRRHMDAQESIKLLIRRIEKNLGELRTFVDDERNAEQDRKHAKMLLDDGEEKLAQAQRIAEELQRHG